MTTPPWWWACLLTARKPNLILQSKRPVEKEFRRDERALRKQVTESMIVRRVRTQSAKV